MDMALRQIALNSVKRFCIDLTSHHTDRIRDGVRDKYIFIASNQSVCSQSFINVI